MTIVGLKEQNVEDVLADAERLRTTLWMTIEQLRALPTATDEEARAVVTWRLALATMSWDVGKTAISTCRDGELRVTRMLGRSLFEYFVRLEYYFHCKDDALRHALQVENFERMILKHGESPTDLSVGDLKIYRRFLQGSIEVEKPNLDTMLKRNLKEQGLKGGERKRAIRDLLGIHYAIDSGFVHGSQGIILDMFRSNDEDEQIYHHETSPRLSRISCAWKILDSFMGMLQAQEMHEGRFLGSDMYARDFELRYGLPYPYPKQIPD